MTQLANEISAFHKPYYTTVDHRYCEATISSVTQHQQRPHTPYWCNTVNNKPQTLISGHLL